MPIQRTRTALPSKNQLRSLKQYKDLSEEEFDDLFEKKFFGIVTSKEFEYRIEKKLNEFAQDYDIDDLKINDRLVLRALAQSLIHLEDMEILSYNIRKEGIGEDNILFFDKLSNVMSKLRNDISSMQDDLKITRRIRKGDKEEGVIALLDSLKEKARIFYDQKMAHIFCPKCNMLLGSIWLLYPDNKNKIVLTCSRDLGNGEICKTVVTVTSKELMEKRGSNRPEILPESMR
jgi:RNase P subunit RPR2